MAVSFLRRKSVSRSPSPSSGSTGSSRSSHSHCEHRLHILDYDLCLSCINDRPRSKSSGSLMSKIARRLGRMNVKPDQYPYDEAPPPCGDDGTDDNVSSTMRREGGHALQVPIPQTQQKRMQSVSSPQLERSSDGYVFTVCTSYHTQYTVVRGGYGGPVCTYVRK